MVHGSISALRREALLRGDRRFTTGEPCKNGHLSERYVSTGQCCACMTSWTLQPKSNIKGSNVFWPKGPFVHPTETVNEAQGHAVCAVFEGWLLEAVKVAKAQHPELWPTSQATLDTP